MQKLIHWPQSLHQVWCLQGIHALHSPRYPMQGRGEQEQIFLFSVHRAFMCLDCGRMPGTKTLSGTVGKSLAHLHSCTREKSASLASACYFVT